MNRKKIIEYMKRYLVLLVGLFIMAFGVALSTKANLGTSPVSCVPYVISLGIPLTMGQVTIIMHILFILIQILLLRRQFQLVQFLQMIVAVVFGCFTDFTLGLVVHMEVKQYLMQWILCAVSWVIIAFGVFLEVKANVIMLAGEGVMLAISKVFHIEFGKVKVGFDCSQVILGTIISFVMFHRLTGIREGTIAAAVFVGMIVRVYNRYCSGFVERFFELEAEAARGETTEQTTVSEKILGQPLVVTIGREFGSSGREIGKQVAQKLNISYVDKELIGMSVKESGFSENYVAEHEESMTNSLLYDLYMQSFAFVDGQKPKTDELFEIQKKVIQEIAEEKSCVIVGRLASFILGKRKNCYHVFIHASQEYKVQHVMERDNLSEREAKHKIQKVENERRTHCKIYTGQFWGMAHNYHLALDSSRYGVEESANIIVDMIKREAVS